MQFPEGYIFSFQKKDLNMDVSKDTQLIHVDVFFRSMLNSYGINSNSHCCSNYHTVVYYTAKPGKEVKRPPRHAVWWENVVSCVPTALMLENNYEHHKSKKLDGIVIE